MLATTPAGTNVANTLYTNATPAPTVTRISGIGHHAWRHFGGDHRHKPDRSQGGDGRRHGGDQRRDGERDDDTAVTDPHGLPGW